VKPGPVPLNGPMSFAVFDLEVFLARFEGVLLVCFHPPLFSLFDAKKKKKKLSGVIFLSLLFFFFFFFGS
jgi:hypothetical protein